MPGAEANPKAEKSTAPSSGKQVTKKPAPEGEAEEESEKKGSSATGGQNPTNGDQGGGQPSGGNGQTKAQNPGSTGKAGIGQAEKVPVSNSGSPVESSGGGGGSSPVVPILIVVAILAAISIGVVVYRQKRQSPSGSVSPKAS